MKKLPLFCYGTLQSPLVMKAVTGLKIVGQAATLSDWARYRVRGSAYPGIKPEQGGQISGKLYRELDEDLIADLDAFEGDKYERVKVTVTLENGSKEEAYAFAMTEDCRTYLSDEPWDFEEFLQNGLEKFIHWFVEDRRDFYDRGDL